jgi:hypothetical protein
MLRYFMFEKVDQGYIIYDFSPVREHCRNYYLTFWTTEDITTTIYNTYTGSTSYTTLESQYLQILTSGPALPFP